MRTINANDVLKIKNIAKFLKINSPHLFIVKKKKNNSALKNNNATPMGLI